MSFRTLFVLLPGLAVMVASICGGNLLWVITGAGASAMAAAAPAMATMAPAIPGTAKPSVTAPVDTPSAVPSAPRPTQALTVRKAWSRATAPGAPVGVVYFEIVNTGATDELLGIESSAAQHVEMHSTMTMGGMMDMRSAETVVIPAAGLVRFEPGGLHAMLKDLKQPLVEGATLPLTLVFRHAGRVAVQAVVLGPGATTGPADPPATATQPAAAHSPAETGRDR